MALGISWVAAASQLANHYSRIGDQVEEEADLAFDGAYPSGGEVGDVSARFASVVSVVQVPGAAGTGGWPFITAANPNSIVAVSHNGGTAAAGTFIATVTTTGAELGAVSAAGLTAVRVRIKGAPLLSYTP